MTTDTTITKIETDLLSGERVLLPGIGTLKVVQRKARAGRNPKTGATIQIPAKKTITFSIAAGMKKALN